MSDPCTMTMLTTEVQYGRIVPFADRSSPLVTARARTARKAAAPLERRGGTPHGESGHRPDRPPAAGLAWKNTAPQAAPVELMDLSSTTSHWGAYRAAQIGRASCRHRA